MIEYNAIVLPLLYSLGIGLLALWLLTHLAYTTSLHKLVKPEFLRSRRFKPISIVIATRGNNDVLDNLLKQVGELGYPIKEIIVVDSSNDNSSYLVALRRSVLDSRLRALRIELGPMVSSKEDYFLLYLGGRLAGKDTILLLLNDSMEIINPYNLVVASSSLAEDNTIVLFIPRFSCEKKLCRAIGGLLSTLIYVTYGFHWLLGRKNFTVFSCLWFWPVTCKTCWRLEGNKINDIRLAVDQNLSTIWEKREPKTVIVDGRNIISIRLSNCNEDYGKLIEATTSIYGIKRKALTSITGAIGLALFLSLPSLWPILVTIDYKLAFLYLTSWFTQLALFARGLKLNQYSAFYALLSLAVSIILVPMSLFTFSTSSCTESKSMRYRLIQKHTL